MLADPMEQQWQQLHEKVEFLKRPSSYPEKTAAIETIETHMSWVFLTDLYAYKLKKPVQLAFLDFSTLEARHFSTKMELKLNKWLAPGVYLGVFPLIADKHNHLHLGASSDSKERVVDWLLKMKRLPRKLMLDQAIEWNDFSLQRLRQAAQKLTEFYQVTDHIVITPAEYRKRLTERIKENYKVLSLPKYGLDAETVTAINSAQLDWLKSHSEIFDQRVREGRLVDGHGDLRPEHICLTSPPVIIDRLEHDPNLRMVDPIDELSFLFIECELLGHADVAKVFFETYKQVSGDDYPAQLIPFFKSLRACNRAKLSIWHLDDARVKNKDKWRLKARAYLGLANVIHG